jgi:hypothetical protein
MSNFFGIRNYRTFAINFDTNYYIINSKLINKHTFESVNLNSTFSIKDCYQYFFQFKDPCNAFNSYRYNWNLSVEEIDYYINIYSKLFKNKHVLCLSDEKQ